MKKEIKFPKGAKSINFDLEKGIATAIYESETVKEINRRKEVKPTYEVGKWYESNKVDEIALVLDEKFHHVSFQNGKFVEAHPYVALPSDLKRAWKPANMDEVRKLLETEFHKKYKEGDKVKSLFEGTECIIHDFWHICAMTGEVWARGKDTHPEVFDPMTGKWAEIIEEKKHLYTNDYGTEFFEGDYAYFVKKSTNEILGGNPNNPLRFGDIGMAENEEFSEIMTKEQAEKYIKDHTPLYTNDYGRKYYGGEDYYYLRDSNVPIKGHEFKAKRNGIRFIGTKKECYQYLADNCKE